MIKPTVERMIYILACVAQCLDAEMPYNADAWAQFDEMEGRIPYQTILTNFQNSSN